MFPEAGAVPQQKNGTFEWRAKEQVQSRVFMRAAWRRLINITYAIDPNLLAPHLPKGVSPDVVDGSAFVSLVPFSFEDVSLWGWRIPFHGKFAEMNLRFYVKSREGRGVVFLQECAPKAAVVWMARRKYNESYVRFPLEETVIQKTNSIVVRHELICKGIKHTVEAESALNSYVPDPGCMDDYFKELELGFGTGKDGVTRIYRIKHPPWEIFPLLRMKIDLDFGQVFGKKWAFLAKERPINMALVKGSPVSVLDIERFEA
ncbi:MAG: hypothetical protein FD123_302 [Bacteroidetes bacterium]|nr:MAG: hypothetical protein FD123_302 [Bacteroidota bacterium]